MNRLKLKDLTQRPAVATIAVALLTVVLAVFLVQAYGKAYRDVGCDFTSYLLSAEALLNGDNPYQTDTPFVYIYPMFLAFALIPLSVLPYWLSNFVWYVMNVAALVGSVYLAIRLNADQINTQWGKHLWAPIVFGLLLLTGVVQNHLLNGQVNFIVLFLCLLFLKYDTQKRWVVASVCLAAAAAIKLVPLILLGYLLLRFRVKTLLLTVGLFVVFCLLPIVCLGSSIIEIYREYLSGFIAGNVSATGQAHSTYYTLHGLMTFVIPSLASVTSIKYLSALLVATAAGGVDLLARQRQGEAASIWTFHLYLLAILLISPISETHHLAFLIPAFVLLLVRMLHADTSNDWLSSSLPVLFVACFYVGKTVAGPFFVIGIAVLFVALASRVLRFRSA